MAFSVVLPIIASAILGLGAIVLYGALFVRGGNSTQQLRAAFFVTAMLAGCISWGSVAFRQPISAPLGKTVYWGHRVGENIALPLIVAGIVLGIFSSFGLRLALPIIAAASMLCLTLGPFVLGGISMWYWFIIGVVVFVFFFITIILGDRLDVVETNLKGGHEHFPHWHGLGYRIALAIAIVVYHLFLTLSPDWVNVTNATTMFILYGCMDIAVGILALVNYFHITVTEPIYDRTNTEASRATRDSVNAPLTRRNADSYTA
jgi:hypothetical protein